MDMTGRLLVSQPTSKSEFFKESVILLVQHDERGAWGIQINKPLDTLSIKDVITDPEVGITNDTKCYLGGPVEQQAIHLLHSSDCVMSNSLPITDTLTITSNATMFKEMEMGRGPSKWICTLGMCTWAPGQLDGEMRGEHPWTPQHQWLDTAIPKDLLDRNPRMLWKECVKTCVENATSTFF